MANKLFLSLGGNIGDTQSNIAKAYSLIEKKVGVILKQSNIIETVAWGMEENTPNFKNSAILVETLLDHRSVLDETKKIEKMIGRNKKSSKGKYQDRLIDIDIIFFNNQSIEQEDLIIPHQFAHEREFVLKPIQELAPDFIHPTLKKSITSLIAELEN